MLGCPAFGTLATVNGAGGFGPMAVVGTRWTGSGTTVASGHCAVLFLGGAWLGFRVRPAGEYSTLGKGMRRHRQSLPRRIEVRPPPNLAPSGERAAESAAGHPEARFTSPPPCDKLGSMQRCDFLEKWCLCSTKRNLGSLASESAPRYPDRAGTSLAAVHPTIH